LILTDVVAVFSAGRYAMAFQKLSADLKFGSPPLTVRKIEIGADL